MNERREIFFFRVILTTSWMNVSNPFSFFMKWKISHTWNSHFFRSKWHMTGSWCPNRLSLMLSRNREPGMTLPFHFTSIVRKISSTNYDDKRKNSVHTQPCYRKKDGYQIELFECNKCDQIPYGSYGIQRKSFRVRIYPCFSDGWKEAKNIDTNEEYHG